MSPRDDIDLIIPCWPVPANVKALSTTRSGGVSQDHYAGLNLALHVNDDSALVWQNRQALVQIAGLPSAPAWLEQVHSTTVLELTDLDQVSDVALVSDAPIADASVSHCRERVCVVMTADCLPLLVCDKAGTQVAAIHAGWRGLLDGIIEQTLAQLSAAEGELLVWLGPAISQTHFQVGDEVRAAFVAHDSQAETAFVADGERWLADLYLLARQRLQALGVASQNIYGGDYCTYTQVELFYSYRRASQTGRQASLIYLT